MVISDETLVTAMERLESLISMSPLKISAGYFCFGVAWIPLTDVALASVFASQEMPALIGLAKGWIFIGLSTLLIYLLTSVHHQQMSTAQTKLETANEQLQVLQRVFRHNIRNDINVIQGYADILTERLDDPTEQQHAEAVCQTAKRITAISDKLKLLERVDPTLDNEIAVDLVEIIEEELDHIESSGTFVDVRTDLPARAWVECDDSIRYAVREVLENAVSHNQTSPCRIHVSLDRSGGMVTLEIDDNGPGIPDGELRSLEAGEETALVHASSVGLWMVKWVSQLHDGAVEFSADSPTGTTVSFQFQAGARSRLIDAGAGINDRIDAVAD